VATSSKQEAERRAEAARREQAARREEERRREAIERRETDLERLDRNLVELLQELRVAQTGVQVLFAFLLTVPFSNRFSTLSGFERGAYFAALVCSLLASILLIAPTSFHRLLFRMRQKEYMVEIANRLALAGLAFIAVAMSAVMLLIADVMFGGWAIAVVGVLTVCAFAVLWYVLPLRRRREIGTPAARR
jgi:Family of unknown function (DUF6328)